jgi:hypothetical protein
MNVNMYIIAIPKEKNNKNDRHDSPGTKGVGAG